MRDPVGGQQRCHIDFAIDVAIDVAIDAKRLGLRKPRDEHSALFRATENARIQLERSFGADYDLPLLCDRLELRDRRRSGPRNDQLPVAVSQQVNIEDIAVSADGHVEPYLPG